MPSFQIEIRIRATPESVFELLTDPVAAKSWVIGLVDIIPSSPGSLQVVGGRFTETLREGSRLVEYDGEVLAYDRPRAYGVRMENAQFSINMHYSLEPVADGTVVHQAVDLNPRSSFVRFLLSVFRFLTRLMLNKQLNQLKRAAEQGVGTPARE
jgi:uncharacterized protein YndB with AHSA1/START domain